MSFIHGIFYPVSSVGDKIILFTERSSFLAKVHHILILISCFQDYAEIVEEEEGDYSSPARDYEIDRSRVELGDIIGEGQVSLDKINT